MKNTRVINKKVIPQNMLQVGTYLPLALALRAIIEGKKVKITHINEFSHTIAAGKMKKAKWTETIALKHLQTAIVNWGEIINIRINEKEAYPNAEIDNKLEDGFISNILTALLGDSKLGNTKLKRA